VVENERAMTASMNLWNGAVGCEVVDEAIEGFLSALEVDRELCCLIKDERGRNRGGRAEEDWRYREILSGHSRAILYCFESVKVSRSGWFKSKSCLSLSPVSLKLFTLLRSRFRIDLSWTFILTFSSQHLVQPALSPLFDLACSVNFGKFVSSFLPSIGADDTSSSSEMSEDNRRKQGLEYRKLANEALQKKQSAKAVEYFTLALQDPTAPQRQDHVVALHCGRAGAYNAMFGYDWGTSLSSFSFVNFSADRPSRQC